MHMRWNDSLERHFGIVCAFLVLSVNSFFHSFCNHDSMQHHVYASHMYTYPPTPRPSSRGRRAGRTKPKLDLEKEWQWVARSVFLQPNQYLISTSIQPSHPTKAKCFPQGFNTSSVPIIGPSNQAKCFTRVWLRAQQCCQGRYVNLKLPAPHPLLLASSKVPKSPLLLVGSKVPKRHRLCRPNGHPLGLNPARVLLFRTLPTTGRYVPFADYKSNTIKASSFTHPLLLAGSKAPKVPKSPLL